MHVDGGGHRFSVRGQDASNVIGDRFGQVKASPSKQLGSPCNVGIFAISKEVSVEKLSLERDVIDHLSPVQGGCSGRSEDILGLVVTAIVGLLTASVEVAQVRSKEDSSGVYNRHFRNPEVIAHRQQFAADGPDRIYRFARPNEFADEIRLKAHVRI